VRRKIILFFLQSFYELALQRKPSITGEDRRGAKKAMRCSTVALHRLLEFIGRVMPRRMKTQYAVCLRSAGFGASLEVRKLYPVLEDSDAEANDLIRIVDESGEDYVYPAHFFQRLTLPAGIQRALRLAS
jgi:hypothetical protein